MALGNFAFIPQLVSNKDLVCILSAENLEIKLGELPKLKLTITNNSKQPIYLIGLLDGSGSEQRMPYYYFIINKPKPDSIFFPRCKLLNPLKKEDFIRVNPGESFNPYARNNQSDWVYDHSISQKETFKNAGVYKISFQYNTTSMNINDFMGTLDLSNNINSEVLTLFKQLIHCKIISNTIEIKVLP